MKFMVLFFCLLLAFEVNSVFGLAAWAADSGKPLEKNGAWESFTYAEQGGKVCYMRSRPVHSAGAPKKRQPAFFTITHRTSDKSVGVVSVTEGFTPKKSAPIQVTTGNDKFDFYVVGDTGWSRDDNAVRSALMKAKTLTVNGMLAAGDKVADSYSLDGFAKSYVAISLACRF